MNLKLKAVLSSLLKKYYKDSVVQKPYGDSRHKLYFERSQHLMFAFKNKVFYETSIQDKARKYITPGSLVFDIGGNIGQYTLFFSDVVGPKGKVVTFEPDSNNFAFLQFNVNINRLDNVVCLRKGIGDTCATAKFFRDTETGGRTGTFNSEFLYVKDGPTEEVSTTTLDKLIDEFGEPDFVKIDVEGFEEQVLKGLTKTLERTVFFIEVRNETKVQVFNYFSRLGYQCFNLDTKEEVQINNADDIPFFANLVFKRPGG